VACRTLGLSEIGDIGRPCLVRGVSLHHCAAGLREVGVGGVVVCLDPEAHALARQGLRVNVRELTASAVLTPIIADIPNTTAAISLFMVLEVLPEI
jgi:hypothetical protein